MVFNKNKSENRSRFFKTEAIKKLWHADIKDKLTYKMFSEKKCIYSNDVTYRESYTKITK